MYGGGGQRFYAHYRMFGYVGTTGTFGNRIAAGVSAGGNEAKGYGNGESQAWVASQVGSQDSKTTIESGRDANIIGSQVQGKRVEVTADNLNIESLQDTAKYKGKQERISGQVTVGYGVSVGGSYGKSKINSDYASVKTQAGILAGDEGYDVNIQNHTELTGGLVTSTDKAEADGKNRFSTGTLNAIDVKNTSSASADGFSLSGSATVSGGEAPKEVSGVKLKEIGENHKDGSSKVELGGVAGVANQGNWGITKGLVTGLLGQVHSSSNENGITTSAINTRNIVIRDEKSQTQLGTSSAEMIVKVNKDDVHQSVNQVDSSQLQSEIERDLAISKSFVDNINNTGDEIYYKIEKKEGNIFVKEKRAIDCESIDCIRTFELDVENLEVPNTKEEAEKLAQMYAHGIFNINDQDRLQGAIQYGGKEYLDNGVLVVRKPYTSIAAELGFTVFERLRAGIDVPTVFGASNASREQVKIWNLLELYNQQNPVQQIDLKHLAHSLGASSTKNAMNWADYQSMKFEHTRLDANTVGTSYPMRNSTVARVLSGGFYDQGYTEKASQLFKGGKVTYAVAPRDIVGTGVQLPWVPGVFSLGIGNTNTTGSNTTGIPLLGIFAGDHTKAYYKNERVIDFLNPSNGEKSERNRKEIINYQQKIWGQIGPKTKAIEFNNKSLIKKDTDER
ncbi:hemagglutinin repeat-containing protein [Actinobacillus equuli subsp. equuli]|nr:hemagglutinin repeat-containing protein [Actinobacillus equuli]MDG4951970.1 hemagglutinin repeat-containing protein [Actinobacillus equuli subsp. equuli]